MREWRYNIVFLYLNTRLRQVVSFTLRPFKPKEMTPATHFIGGWMDSTAVQIAVEERKMPCPAGNRTPPSSL
jgi:hypothetical protein